MNKVAVVILNWNGAELLKQFLPSVLRYTKGEQIDIVVADNASTDNSVSVLNTEFPSVKCIELTENFGYAQGYNQALKQIDATYYVLLNSDVEVSNDWLKPIIDYLDKNEGVAAAQPKILGQRNKTYFEYAGASGGFMDKYGYPFCRGRIFDTIQEDIGQYNSTVDVLWASGACLIIRASDFREVGGFDASFFAHMEEIDLCWRLNARGRRVVCIPQSIVYHVGGATLAGESAHKTFLNFRNNLLMLYKNLPAKEVKKVLRIRKYLDYLAALKFCLSGKRANANAIHRAHNEFKRIKNNYTESRIANMKLTVVSEIATIYPQSILKDYYVRGKKHFSQLIYFN